MLAKPENRKKIFLIFLIASSVAGAYIASTTIYQYEIIIKGLLGLATLYLTHSLFFPPKNFVINSVNMNIEFPKDAKYIIVGFFLTMTTYWSAQHLLDTILYFLMLFSK